MNKIFAVLVVCLFVLAKQSSSAEVSPFPLNSYPSMRAGLYNATLVSHQVFYFIGAVDVLLQSSRHLGKRNPYSACEPARRRNWMRAAIIFDAFVESPQIFNVSIESKRLKKMPAIEVIEKFLPLYCNEFSG